MTTLINWFEIPVQDMDRACAFYETVFATKLNRQAGSDGHMAVFPYTQPATGGALCRSEHHRPGASGCIPYLNGGEDLAQPLGRAEKLGATVLLGKTMVAPEVGYMALFRDCEGNTIGLHSRA